ncbi:hypothetical protein T06_17045 [Trichinella sp. T6]|nr:hypothetical protein T06_17045 [Trichinella sp. T6]
MYIIEALIAVILNQMQNNRYSIYYATLFALYSLELHTAFINVVNYILQIIASSVQRHYEYVSLASVEYAEFFLLLHPLQVNFEARIDF